MSIILQFNCLTHNETARKAMENYIGILQKAFEHYQNLWEDYIKLQEKCGQCNIQSSSQMTVDTSCTKRKDEVMSEHLDNTNVQENNSIPLLELDTINTSSINFNSDMESMETGSSDGNESSKNTNENNPPESPTLSKRFLRIDNNSAKKSMRSSKMVHDNSSLDIKTHRSFEKVSSKSNHKLEISTTHHVETTFLPNGKKLKQSQLTFNPVKSNENMILSSSVNKHKAANMHNVEQNFVQDISMENAITNATVIKNDVTNNTSEISEDVVEISPTQRNVTSKVKRCLRLKRKLPVKHILKKDSLSKIKCPDPSIVPRIIEDFGLCLSSKHTSMQMEEDKPRKVMNTAVKTLKDKVNVNYLLPVKMLNKTDTQIKKSIEVKKKDQLSVNKILGQSINDFTYEDETFYLPAEQAANTSDTDNLTIINLDNTENKPPEKKKLDKFNILPKRKADISEQLNMRCKSDRAKLNGWDCWECREYYKNLSLSEEELQKRKNHCSRHRYKYERPNTPEGFWDPEFPETLSSTYRTK